MSVLNSDGSEKETVESRDLMNSAIQFFNRSEYNPTYNFRRLSKHSAKI